MCEHSSRATKTTTAMRRPSPKRCSAHHALRRHQDRRTTRLASLTPVRSRLVSERTAIANEIRALLLDRGIAVSQGLHRLREALPDILATRTDLLAPRLLHILEDLIGDWRRLDERIHAVSLEIQLLAQDD